MAIAYTTPQTPCKITITQPSGETIEFLAVGVRIETPQPIFEFQSWQHPYIISVPHGLKQFEITGNIVPQTPPEHNVSTSELREQLGDCDQPLIVFDSEGGFRMPPSSN